MQTKMQIEDIDTDEIDLIIAGVHDPIHRFDEEDEPTDQLVLVTAAPSGTTIGAEELRWIEWELNMAESVLDRHDDPPAERKLHWTERLLEELDS